MKIQCLVQNLKEGILNAEQLTSKNQTLPVLGSIFLGVEKDRIKIRSTNLESALEMDISGKVKESGSLVAPARALSMFLSGISEDQITLESQKNNLFVKTSKTETTLMGYSPEDFPIFPKPEFSDKFEIPSADLRGGLISVLVASSYSDLKPELNSVFFNIFKNTIKLAATDSFRLAEKSIISKNIYTNKQISFLVPKKTASELLKLLDKKEEIVNIGVNKNQLVVSAGNFKFISRLTEGNFPDYEQIIPKSFKTVAIAKRSDVLSHLKLTSVFVGKLNDLTVSLIPEKKSIIISTNNSESGAHSSSIDSTIQGSDISLKFNWRYLLDGVSQINQDYVSFQLNSDQSPMLIRGKNDNSYLYLAMPMRGV